MKDKKINWKRIAVKPVINKTNSQINISLPKRKMSKAFIDKAKSGKLIDLLFEED